MKTWKLIGMMLLLAAGVVACNDETEEGTGGDGSGDTPEVPVDSVNVDTVPAIVLENEAGKFWAVLQHVQPEYGKSLGTTVLSDIGWTSFKKIADDWCEGLTDVEKIDTIFRMVSSTLQQGGMDQSPEVVWETGYGTCQGYSDVFKVFCLTQDIPCLGANGLLYNEKPYSYGAAHAWTYAYADGEWWLVDCLWGRKCKASELAKWAVDWDDERSEWGISWQPQYVNVMLAEDDLFEYNYDRGLNIYGIKDGAGEELTVPDECAVFENEPIVSFSPYAALPEEVKTIYLGENIAYLGEEETNFANGSSNLKTYATSLEWMDVEESNVLYSSYEGVIYREGYDGPLYVPGAMKVVKFRPVELAGSEFLTGNDIVEEVWFAEGTGEVKSSALIDCSNLQVVYVPEDTQCPKTVGGVLVTRYRTNSNGEIEIIN